MVCRVATGLATTTLPPHVCTTTALARVLFLTCQDLTLCEIIALQVAVAVAVAVAGEGAVVGQPCYHLEVEEQVVVQFK